MPSSALKTKTDLQIAIQKALLHNKIVFLKFGAKWCGPCKKIAPAFEELGKKWINHVLLYTVDADESTELIDFYKVKSLPTFLVIYKNNVINMWEGIYDFNTKCEMILSKLIFQNNPKSTSSNTSNSNIIPDTTSNIILNTTSKTS
jgi:thioredoxin 1